MDALCIQMKTAYLKLTIKKKAVSDKKQPNLVVIKFILRVRKLSWKEALLQFLGDQDHLHSNLPDKQPHIEVLHGSHCIRYIYPKRCNKIHLKQEFA